MECIEGATGGWPALGFAPSCDGPAARGTRLMWYAAPYGLGWHPDLPDPRDYTPQHPEVVRLLESLKPSGRLPRVVDWREYCPEAADQGAIPASAAHACAALLSYFDRRATGRQFEPSRAFLHQTAGRLLTQDGDGGEELRATWKAVVRFGLPTDRQWPYDAVVTTRQPDAFIYAVARRFPSLCYLRLDPRGAGGEDVLATLKSFLAAGFAAVFGFSVCSAMLADAEIPYPTVFDGILGGQAAMAVGYDDARRIRSHRGALLVLNSRGPAWGDRGFGWLPYAYVREQLARDFWTVLTAEWLASGEFKRPG